MFLFPVASLKRVYPYKLFAGSFHFKRLLLLSQYSYRLNGYLLTTGQIYGFYDTLPNVCYPMYINGKTPALFFRGYLLIKDYTLSNFILSDEYRIIFSERMRCIELSFSLHSIIV